MTQVGMMKYFGWSAISIETDDGPLTFDPFFRPYCGASWFRLSDFQDAKYICVTHGHEEHFLDVPIVAKTTGATVIGAPSVCSFLRKRRGIADQQMIGVDPHKFETATIPGCKITVFPWKHRDINVLKAISKAVFFGNATQLSWAWSSATQAPFYAPYTGFYLEFSNGLRVLNYNEGFNSKMTDGEIDDLGARFQTDVLLAGMQLDFVDDVVRGVAALKPKAVVLYPPHEKFHEMMGAKSKPWSEFEAAVNASFPNVKTYVATPGYELNLNACTGQ